MQYAGLERSKTQRERASSFRFVLFIFFSLLETWKMRNKAVKHSRIQNNYYIDIACISFNNIVVEAVFLWLLVFVL
jgi:hypothetical protein